MSYRTEIGLVLLLALAVTLALVAGSGSSHPATARWEPLSTYRTGPMGARGAYDVLVQLGVPVERRRTPLFDLNREERRRPPVLPVVGPEGGPLPAHPGAGGRLVGT